MNGHSNHVVKAHEIINVNVKNTAKEDLGKITEIMLDKKSGQTTYVVLSCGGFLGLGEKLFALPWNDFQYDKKEECFIVNIAKEKLESAAGFNKDNWPDMPSQSLQ